MAEETILMVDDDRNIRRLLENFLRSAGFAVLQAESGEEALHALSRSVPDLVLLDVQMKGMDGLATLKAIRARKNLRNVPVVFLTSAADPEVKAMGMEAEADDYVLKTTPKEELVARVKAALERAKRSRDIASAELIRGDLSEKALAEVLKEAAKSGRPARVSLKGMEAVVFMNGGRLVHASKGPFTGAQALTRMFYEETGPFVVEYGEIPPEIPQNPVELATTLANVATYVDGVKAHIRKLDVEDRAVNIDYELAEYSEFLEFRDMASIAFVELMLKMKGSLTQNLKRILTGIKERELSLV
ncbi:MAG: response regulator [Thermodesulfobacteriota bacterium]